MSATFTPELERKPASLLPGRNFSSAQHAPGRDRGGDSKHTESRQETSSRSDFGLDISGLPTNATTGAASHQPAMQSCPLSLSSPRTCPFGGACHTCPVRIQTKLTINKPGDEYEQEADRVADTVMRMPEPSDKKDITGPTAGPTLRRKCSQCPDEETLQRRTQNSEPKTQDQPSVPPVEYDVLRSPGQPLDPVTRAFFEPRFGHDFSRIRVHDDAQADHSTRSVGARAYTVGSHLAFASGQYAPHTPSGRHLLAHELAHTVQQTSAPRLQRMPWGQCPTGKEVDARGWLKKGGYKKKLKGVASAFKIYSVAELAAVNYYKFHPMNVGHCVMTNLDLASNNIPATCAGQDKRTAEMLTGKFHRDNSSWRKPNTRALDPNISERVEALGGAVSESIRIAAVLQPDILDITAREVYDVTTSRMSGQKWIKLFLTYASRLTDLTSGLPWKAGTRLPGPGPQGGTISQGDYTICYRNTDFDKAPGVIQYVAIEKPGAGDDDSGKKKKKDKEPKKEKKAKEEKKKKKKPDSKKPPTKFGNVGFGLGVGSTGSGAGNATLGVSIVSNGAAYGTVSGGIVYNSNGIAVGAVSAGAGANATTAAAASASTGAQQASETASGASVGAGSTKDTTGAQAASATKGAGSGGLGAQAGKAGTAGKGEHGGEGGDIAGGTPKPTQSAKGQTPGAQPAGNTAQGGAKDAGVPSAEGGPGEAAAGGAGPGGAASKAGAEGGSGTKPLLNIPGATPDQVNAAIQEAAAIDARLQAVSSQRRTFLDHLARTEADPAFMIPETAWVKRMLDITEGVSDADLKRLEAADWAPSNESPEEVRAHLREALAQDKAKAPATPSPDKPAPDATKLKAPSKPAPKKTEKEAEPQADRVARLAQRAREFDNWKGVAAASGRAQLRHANVLNQRISAEIYIITREDKTNREIRATADAEVTIKQVSGKKTVAIVHWNSEFVTPDGEYSTDYSMVGTREIEP